MPAPVLSPRPPTRTSAGRRSYGILSTYAPTPCGIATFSAALAGELSKQPGTSVGIVRVGGAPGDATSPDVVGELRRGPGSVSSAVALLNQFDVAVVQHEYGIYAGDDGDQVLEVLDGLTVPVVLVAHTVVESPTPHQREVLQIAARTANAVVVMTDAARRRLCLRFGVDEDKVVTIPHGAAMGAERRPARPAPPTILSWGLLGPGKGVEWVIDAMCEIGDLMPRPRYVIAGRTHPNVLAADGEAYRSMLTLRARMRGVESSVWFDPAYRDAASLAELIHAADVVVLPYDSTEQVTSGVLVDAVAAGRPVIATAFPHAVELLSGGAGIVVPHGNPSAIAAALRRVLTEPDLASSMGREARRLASELAWPSVATQYALLSERLLDRATLAV